MAATHIANDVAVPNAAHDEVRAGVVRVVEAVHGAVGREGQLVLHLDGDVLHAVADGDGEDRGSSESEEGKSREAHDVSRCAEMARRESGTGAGRSSSPEVGKCGSSFRTLSVRAIEICSARDLRCWPTPTGRWKGT